MFCIQVVHTVKEEIYVKNSQGNPLHYPLKLHYYINKDIKCKECFDFFF